MDSVVPIILELVSAVLVLVITGAVGALIRFVRSKTTEKQQEIIREAVRAGVLFAQQVIPEEGALIKFEKAKERAVNILVKSGIKITETQIDTLIESVLKELKKEFGDTW